MQAPATVQDIIATVEFISGKNHLRGSYNHRNFSPEEALASVIAFIRHTTPLNILEDDQQSDAYTAVQELCEKYNSVKTTDQERQALEEQIIKPAINQINASNASKLKIRNAWIDELNQEGSLQVANNAKKNIALNKDYSTLQIDLALNDKYMTEVSALISLGLAPANAANVMSQMTNTNQYAFLEKIALQKAALKEFFIWAFVERNLSIGSAISILGNIIETHEMYANIPIKLVKNVREPFHGSHIKADAFTDYFTEVKKAMTAYINLLRFPALEALILVANLPRKEIIDTPALLTDLDDFIVEVNIAKKVSFDNTKEIFKQIIAGDIQDQPYSNSEELFEKFKHLNLSDSQIDRYFEYLPTMVPADIYSSGNMFTGDNNQYLNSETSGLLESSGLYLKSSNNVDATFVTRYQNILVPLAIVAGVIGIIANSPYGEKLASAFRHRFFTKAKTDNEFDLTSIVTTNSSTDSPLTKRRT